MERARRRRQEEPVRESLPEVHVEETTAPATPDEPGNIHVIWGPVIEPLAGEGMTVTEVRTLLQNPFKIPAHAQPFVNSEPASPEHRLAAGDTLEFVRESGEKGTKR